MERCYNFAGITFCVCGPDGKMFRNEEILAPFTSTDKEADCNIEFQIVDELLPPEGNCIFRNPTVWIYESNGAQIRYHGPLREGISFAYLRIYRQGANSHVQVLRRMIPEYIPTKLVLNALETEHRIVRNHGFLLHASFISHEGNAILFTAPSGTGKSTQADLWCRLRGAEQINGDRAAVIISPKGIHACGVPYSGSSGICKNAVLPLKAIVFLSQAPETEISRLRGVRAFRRVWEGCSINVWDRQDVDLCISSVTEMIATVPIFHLACTPDESAVLALEEALRKQVSL